MTAQLLKNMPQDVTQNILEMAAFCNCHRKFGADGTPTAKLFGFKFHPPAFVVLSILGEESFRNLVVGHPYWNFGGVVRRMDLRMAAGDLSNRPVDETKWQCEYCEPHF